MVGKLSGKFRGNAVRVTDQRVKLMNEVLSCVKLIKMYAWEQSFANVIGGKLCTLYYCRHVRGHRKTFRLVVKGGGNKLGMRSNPNNSSSTGIF